MLKNYFKIALRNLLKHKGFSAIQICGLAISISITLVIGMLVHHEFSYDRFHKDSDRIYRIVSFNTHGGREFPNSGVSAPMAEAVKNDITGLEEVAAFHIWQKVDVTIPEKRGSQQAIEKMDNIIFTSPDYFRIFPSEWLAGSPATALSQAYNVVLSENKAKEYFSLDDAREAVGKDIIYQDSIQVTVSGVVKDTEQLSDFTFKEFISLSTIHNTYLAKDFHMEDWDNTDSDSQLFVKIKQGVDPSKITAQFPAFLSVYLSEFNRENRKHELQTLSDIHFNEQFDNFRNRLAHKPTLYGLLLLSFFILILACINFINLSTAQSGSRKKEISVRKSFGGSKKQLVYQFISESILKTLVAAFISVLLLPFLFNYFSDFLPADLAHSNYLNWSYFILLLLFVVFLGFLSGIYPAFFLASFRPFWLLKGKSGATVSKNHFQKVLIVFQFSIAFCLIIGSFVISQQVKFGFNKDLGYEKDAIVNVSLPTGAENIKYQQFLQKLKAIPDLANVALAGEPPASYYTMSRTIDDFHRLDKESRLHVEFKYGDNTYIEFYNLKFMAGRKFSASDSRNGLIINETLAKRLGFETPIEAIGHTIKIDEEKSIVGVVADFHTKSIHHQVEPLIIAQDPESYEVLHVKLLKESAHWKAALTKTESAWQEVFPNEDFSYQFFDEKIATFYNQEIKLNKLLNWATGIAIFISCLGLLGIVSFTIQQKTKEIGIRKVLGASISSVLMLLSKDFIKLIFIAFIVATPIGYYLIKEWLNGFAYKIDLQWWLFVIPGIAVLLISIMVLSTQSIRAALANPVDSLRSE